MRRMLSSGVVMAGTFFSHPYQGGDTEGVKDGAKSNLPQPLLGKEGSRNYLAVCAVVLSLVVVTLFPATAQPVIQPAPESITPATPVIERLNARCVKVLTGDRIEVVIAGGRELKITYLGVDLPNPEDPNPDIRKFYRKAFALNRELVEGKVVMLEFEQFAPAKGGRYEAYVFCDKTFVNGELIRQGLALPDEAQFQMKRFYLKKAALAKEERLGLWSLVPPEIPPAPASQPTPVKNSFFESEYYASQNSAVFHRPSCKWAQKIKEKNRLTFKSRADAMNAGLRPCKMCKP